MRAALTSSFCYIKQEAKDYVAMIYQSEGDNHAIINYVVHGLGLMFGAHTNTGTIVILSWYHFHSWPILILCIICGVDAQLARWAGSLLNGPTTRL